MKVKGGNPSKARQPFRRPVFAGRADDGFDDLIDLLAILFGHSATERSSFPEFALGKSCAAAGNLNGL